MIVNYDYKTFIVQAKDAYVKRATGVEYLKVPYF